jgi:hypothetical protein
MRLLTLSKLLALAGVVAWSAKRFTRSKPPEPTDEGLTARDLAPDPGDPVQGFDEAADLQVSDLDFDAVDAADAEAAQDLASLESELESGLDDNLDTSAPIDAADVSLEETGELYGVHTPRAVDHDLLDNDASFAEGQNWIEALETSSVEYGAEPEADLDIVDDMDVAPHPSDMRDTPVADRGSGGPAGV